MILMKMNRKAVFKKGIFFLSIILFTFNLKAQFVSLDGKQFKLNGADFYPIVCNYGFQVIYNTGTTNYYLSPNYSYGEGITCSGCGSLPNYEYDCDDQPGCTLQIHNEMMQIRNMGFNAIRTYGMNLFKIDPAGTGVIGFEIEAIENRHPLWSPAKQFISITPSPFAYDDPLNTNMQLLFSFYDVILQEAQACSLKVILDLAYGDIAKNSVNVNDYAAFLSALADRYKNNPTLMAYVVIEEPSLLRLHEVGLKKQDICNITTIWYDAIKTIDPLHLITIGGNDLQDILLWDPGVMKIDFYSPHPYPTLTDYENYSVTEAKNRVLTQLIWLQNNCPMPWIIGETGFSAYQNMSPPAVDGTEQEQLDYAQFMLENVRNTGGSGISWWNYQEHWWAGDYYQNGFGLLRHGPTNSSSEKLVSQAFRGYPHPAPVPTSVIVPSNYYNVYNLIDDPVYNYEGIIFNENTGDPIGDAIIFCFNSYYINNPDPLNPIKIHKVDFIHSFSSNLNGTIGQFKFEVLHPNAVQEYFPNGNAYPLTEILKATITKDGSECESGGPWTGLPLPNPIFLKSNLFDYNTELSYQTIDQTNSPRSFKGWNGLSLNYSNSVLNGGSVEFRARNEININDEFISVLGSEASFICERTFADCIADLDGFLKISGINSQTSSFELSEREIEINFISTKLNDVKIIPNPNNGFFKIEHNINSEERNWEEIFIYNVYGNIIYKNKFLNDIELNLSDIPTGIYFIQLKSDTEPVSRKLIIN